jgi:hypothetical protein
MQPVTEKIKRLEREIEKLKKENSDLEYEISELKKGIENQVISLLISQMSSDGDTFSAIIKSPIRILFIQSLVDALYSSGKSHMEIKFDYGNKKYEINVQEIGANVETLFEKLIRLENRGSFTTF